LFFFLLVAQTLAPPFTVEDAVRLAAANNPRVLAAVREIGAAQSGVRSARALANPSAFVAPGVTSVSGTGEEFLIQQPLEINGARSARTGVARAQLRASQAQAVLSLGDVIYATRSAYYELARAREQAAVTRESWEVAQEFDRIARRQVEAGARAGIDLAQTGLEVSRAQRQVTLAEGQVAVASAALNAALGRDPDETIGTLTALSALPEGMAADPAVQRERALASRAEIQAGQATGEQYRQEARLARAEGRPDLVPQFRVGYFTRGLQPASEGNGAGIGIALTLPLLDYGSRRDRIRQAEQSASAQEARVAALQNEVRQQVSAALSRQSAAEAVVRSYRGGVLEQARRLLEGSRVGFQEGRTSVVALLEAQRSFRAVQSEYVNALADAAIARAELERATGAPQGGN
jgi:cobalt-zinc-cadmium efflux system outer membrane protein